MFARLYLRIHSDERKMVSILRDDRIGADVRIGIEWLW